MMMEEHLLMIKLITRTGFRLRMMTGGMAETTVNQQPVVRPNRNRKPNSKYDPTVFELDSVQIKEILVSGRKNGWRGVYWPQ